MNPIVENVEPGKARKRANIKTKRKKAEKQQKLYSAPGLPKKSTCTHNSKTLKCMLLTSKDLFYFHKGFYGSTSKIEQDNYILKHMVVSKVKRNRPRKGIKNPRTFTVKFYIPSYTTKAMIPVCKKTFKESTRLKSSRIEGVAKRHFNTGGLAKENRGGNRKQFAFASKAEAVEKFIKSFTPLESHYCRGQKKVRQYLEPGLNIKKMFKMYNDQALPGFSVKQGFFRKIFNTRFNLGFGSPRTDVCSLCLELTHKIKTEKSEAKKQEYRTQHRIHKLRSKCFYKMLQEEVPGLMIISFDCEKNLPLPKIPDQATYYARQLYLYNFKTEKSEAKKQEYRTQHRIHKLRSKCFYKMLQEEVPGLMIISFDCEKNLPLPKIPDQATYYARQLYLYNFSVVIGTSHTPLTPDTVKAYIWTEDEAAKGSNEICSALYHCINTIDLTGVKKIRFVSDGCGGQNKNSIIICMIMKWLQESTTNIKEIEMIFPVTGHSFLPADRVFALIERVIKKRENIIMPIEYENIIKEHATIHKLASEVPVYDWKKKTREFLKNTQSWHFQISKCKRVLFKKVNENTVHVEGEISYRNNTCQKKSLVKRGKRLNELIPNSIPTGIPVKAVKLIDVNNLLTKHFGSEWQNSEMLSYYKNILATDNAATLSDSESSVVGPGDIENEEIIDFV